jgi:hypothetical protein
MNQLAEAFKDSFITRESCGTDNHYMIHCKFETLSGMQEAYAALLNAMNDEEPPKGGGQ